MHAIDGANIADIQGTIFHFKFLQDFDIKLYKNIEKGEMIDSLEYYKKISKNIKRKNNLNFYYDKSIKYKNNNQLIKMGLMISSTKFNEYNKEK